MTHTYDPDKVSVIINGTIITGFDASGVFTYTRSNDIVTPEVGVQGDVAYVVSETPPEKTNVLWIQPNGLTHFWDGSQWVAVAGVYAEEEIE